MEDAELEPVTLRISDQTFRLRVPPGDRERYQRIAQKVNGLLGNLVEEGATAGPRALAMTAFEIAVEADDLHEELVRTQATTQRLNELIKRIDRVTEIK